MLCKLENYISVADRHFEDGLDRFERQIIRLEARQFENRDVTYSAAVLATMKRTLAVMKAHREVLGALRYWRLERTD